MNKAIDTVLGKNTTEYKENYAPDYLVAIDRQDNRTYLGIQPGEPPFTGFDVWHDYEASFLVNGCPITGILKIVIPANSRYTVESKSLKLYLFSFVMEDMGSSTKESILAYENVVRKDLSQLLSCPVSVCFHQSVEPSILAPLCSPLKYMAAGHVIYLDNTYRPAGIALDPQSYKENPDCLQTGVNLGSNGAGELFVVTDALKSNCKVTHQPDWGQLYIYMQGGDSVSLESLYRYIVSFRGENHFHEEIVECIFQRLMAKYKPGVLDVAAFYTRRGGIDICPMRSTRDNHIFTRFADPGLCDYRAGRS